MTRNRFLQEWPVDGGHDLSDRSNESHNLLITGHEDGSVKVCQYLLFSVCSCTVFLGIVHGF